MRRRSWKSSRDSPGPSAFSRHRRSTPRAAGRAGGRNVTCPSCGQENPAGARFCNGCGMTVEGLCPRCGKANPAGSRFCNSCGGPLQAAATAERVADPRSYTPKHLAEKILTTRSALEGERKQVTVLFADVKGASSGTFVLWNVLGVLDLIVAEGRVGHRRGTGRRRGVAVSGPSSGLRRCLDPCRSPSPASPSIIPDGEISPVRLEAKAFPVEPSRLIRGSSDGAHTPRVMWFAPRLVRSVFSRFCGHSVPVARS